MSPQAHTDSAQQPIILLSVCLLHHLRRKIWSCLSTFTAVSKALTDQIILCLYRLCISARRTRCTNTVLLWCGASTGKYHFTHNKWSKESGCIWTCMPSVLLCFVVVPYVYRKKGLRMEYESYLKWKKLHLLQEMQELTSVDNEGNSNPKSLYKAVMWQFAAGLHRVRLSSACSYRAAWIKKTLLSQQ